MKLSRHFFALLLLTTIACGPPEPPGSRTITVSGSGEVEALPDAATIVMAVEARHRSLAPAQEKVSETVEKFLGVCDGLEIDRERVETTGLRVEPEYRWNDKKHERQHVGYVASRELTIDLRDLSKLGALLEQSVGVGVNRVSPPDLRSTRDRDLRREALAKAIKDARANAEALAKPLGASIGNVRTLDGQEQSDVPIPMPRIRAMIAETATDQSAAETYESGKLRYVASVKAVFDLKP